MRRLVIVGMLLAASSLLPTSQAQAAEAPSIVAMDMAARPVVGLSVGSLVTVWNPDDIQQQSVTVAWSYGDNAPLNPQTPTQAYNQMTQVIDPNTNFTFNFPFTPDATHKGNQTIVAKIVSMGGPATAPGPNSTRSHAIFVANPVLNVTMDTAPLPGVINTGVAFFKFHVRNDGNVEDRVNVSFTKDPNFNITVLANLSPIPPGKSAIGEVLVRPLTDNESINLTANLSVESVLSRLVNVTLPMPPIHVNSTLLARNHTATLTPLPSNLQVRATGNRTVSVTLTNTGEGSNVYNVSTAVTPASSGMNVTLRLGQASANRSIPQNSSYVVGLHPRESVTFDLVLAYNASMGDGNATLSFNATGANADLLAPRHPDLPAGVSTSSRLAPAGPEPALLAIDGPTDAYPTDPRVFRFEVSNLGLDPTRPATLRAIVQDNLQVVARQNVSVPALAAGESVTLSWGFPMADLRGHYALAATLEPHPEDTDADPTDNIRSFAFYVRSPALKLDVPSGVSVTPGSTLSIVGGPRSLLLKNLGDKEETFRVTLASPAAEWISTTWTIPIPSGVTMTLPLNVSVPAHVGTTAFVAAVHAEILGHVAYHDDAEIAVEVIPIDAPVLVFAPVPDGVVGRAQTFDVAASDSIGVRHVEARIVRPDGSTHVVPLLETADGRWSASYTPELRGSYAIEMFAEGEGDAERSGRATQPWNVTAAPYAGVVPVGFRDNGVVGNTTLRFDDAQPGTTRLLVADVGRGPEPVPYPYEIQATFWKDGKHTLYLTATSIDGTAWQSTLNVTLDRTPPTLTDATVQKQSDGKLLLSVRSAGASSVAASISTPAGPISVPMTRSGSGEFVGTALAPSEWDSVTFVSTGQNGVEASVVVSSSSGKLVPVPGWGAIVAIVIAMGLVRVARRRT